MAALIVVLGHLTYGTFGAVYPALYRSPVVAMLSGQLAVAVFFVISGEALTASYLAGGEPVRWRRWRSGGHPGCRSRFLPAS